MTTTTKPLEVIKWKDITGSAEWGGKLKPADCITVGWVIENKPDYLVTASSKVGRVYGGKTAIPLGCVISRTIIGGGNL